MKKLLLILFVITSVVKQTHSQTNVYQPFPNDSVIWGYGSQDPNNGTTYTVIQWLGDTVINSKTYKKQFINSSNNPFYVYSGLYYSCGIRQDIPNEKIYKIINGVETDISVSQHLQVGDTTLPIFAACPKWPYRIVSIDSVQIGNKFHKRYNCKEDSSSLGTESYIVGVGEISYTSCFEGTSGLSCFSVHNNILYGDPNAPYCPQLVSTNNYEQLKNDFSISPNPFSKQTTLQTNKNLQNVTLTVYNSFGQEVKEIRNISGQAITLQRDNLPSGIYFLRITAPPPLPPSGGTTVGCEHCSGGGVEVIATSKLIISDN